MARCYDCNKFVSLDNEAELDSDDVTITCFEKSDDGTTTTVTAQVNVSATLHRNCADCGTEVKTGTFELEETEVEHVCDKWQPDSSFNIDTELVETDRAETTKTVVLKSGEIKKRPIPYRFQKTYYGVEASVTLTCDACGGTVDLSLSDDMPASYFDEV